MKSRYDSTKHHRRSIRLRGYEYASPGTYFVTIVVDNRECLFDNYVFRRIAEWNWKAIPRHFENVVLGEWVVMPNHIHGIIIITDDAHDEPAQRRGEASANTQSELTLAGDIPIKVSGNQDLADASPFQGLANASPLPGLANASPLPSQRARGVSSGALGAIVGNFKSITTRRINGVRHLRVETIWQRNYYEHIVRSERESNRIREYIATNPSRWEWDRNNPVSHPVVDSWLADEKIWFSKSNLKSLDA